MNKIRKIPMFSSSFIASRLTSGWSEDEKWKVTIRNSESYVVRFSSKKELGQKEIEFTCMKNICKNTRFVPEVITYGVLEDEDFCYIVYRFVEGVELIDIIDKLSESVQYRLGLQAGTILKTMHNEVGPSTISPYDQMKRKIERKKELYATSGLVEPYHDLIVQYLDDNLEQLKGQTTSFCHGDFHLGNMLLGKDNNLYVIDFNRSNIEDSYQDFNRMLSFGVKHSIPFVQGQIKGYFGNEAVPERFFRIALFYACMDIGFGILWAMQFGEEEIKVHNSLVTQILRDFSNLTSVIPVWWKE